MQLLLSILELQSDRIPHMSYPPGLDKKQTRSKLSREVVLIGMQAGHTGSVYVDEYALRNTERRYPAHLRSVRYAKLTMLDAKQSYN